MQHSTPGNYLMHWLQSFETLHWHYCIVFTFFSFLPFVHMLLFLAWLPIVCFRIAVNLSAHCQKLRLLDLSSCSLISDSTCYNLGYSWKFLSTFSLVGFLLSVYTSIWESILVGIVNAIERFSKSDLNEAKVRPTFRLVCISLWQSGDSRRLALCCQEIGTCDSTHCFS